MTIDVAATLAACKRATSAIQLHARESYPAESVGVVLEHGYHRCVNVAGALGHDPARFFHLDPGEWISLAPDAIAVVHSHPGVKLPLNRVDNTAAPSEADMRSQIDIDLPYGVVSVLAQPKLNAEGKYTGEIDTEQPPDIIEPYYWHDDLPIPPLLNRHFRHGPSGTDGCGDCYALIRDVFRGGAELLEPVFAEHGGEWPFEPMPTIDFPRDDSWWGGEQRKDLYRQGFEAAGFEQLAGKLSDLRVGDVLLTHILSPVPNHGAVYLGNGLLIHHKPMRLSNVQPAGSTMAHGFVHLRRRT